MTIQSQLDHVLAPCPFCGGEPFDHAIEPHTHSKFLKDIVGIPDHGGSHVVECGCGAGFIADTKAEVFALWNRRAAVVGEAVAVAEDDDGMPVGYADWYNRKFFGQVANTQRDHHCEEAWRAAIAYASPPATAQAVAWVSSEAASLLRKLPSCAAAFRSFDVNAASVKRDDRSVPIYLQPPATVDVVAGKEALTIIDKWMESYHHMGTGTSAVARMSEREWEEDRAKLAALIGKEA